MAESRFVYDPRVGAYLDTYTGQYVLTIPSTTQQTDTTFVSNPSAGTTEAYPEFGPTPIPDEGWATGQSTMTAAPATVAPVPMADIESGEVQALELQGHPTDNALVPDDYQLAELGQVPGMDAPAYIVEGDATTQQIPVPAPLYPGSGWVDPALQPQPEAATGTGGSGSGGGGGGGGGGWVDYGSGSGSRGGGGGGSSDNAFMRGRDPMDNIPAYADGSRHPAAGGDPLTPGGKWNDGDSSRSYQRPRSSGARIGGYYDPRPDRRYNKAPGNTFGLGHGWEPSPGQERAWMMRSHIMNTMVNPALGGAMGMGGTTGGTTTTGGSGGGGGGQQTTEEDAMRRARGWAGRQGFTPAKLEDIYYNPQYLYPHILPGLSTGSNFFAQLDDQLSPNLQTLWSATAGSQRKAGTGPDHYANWLNRVVKSYSTPGGNFFDTNQLMRGLLAPQRGSVQWKAQQGTPFGEQAYNLTNQIGAIANTTMNPMAATATMAYLDTLLNQAGSKNLKRGPKKQIDPNKYVGRRLFR